MQDPVNPSLSTAESELHGIANGIQVALGMKSMSVAELGLTYAGALSKVLELGLENCWAWIGILFGLGL